VSAKEFAIKKYVVTLFAEERQRLQTLIRRTSKQLIVETRAHPS
jgi:hypothetical protein